MNKKAKYKQEVIRLLEMGFEAKDIELLTNIPHATVYRYVDKLRTEARYDFETLMEKDFLYKYGLNLQNYAKSIQECNAELALIDNKYKVREKEVRELMDELPEKAVMVKSNYMAQIIQLDAQKSNEKLRCIAQRDRSTELKAKVYNAGPVVRAVEQFVNQNISAKGDEPQLVLGKVTEAKEMTAREIHGVMNKLDPADKALLDEMEGNINIESVDDTDVE